MISLNKKTYLLILFILSIIILISAYIIQYVFGYQPCNLCLIERIPYVLVIIILIINYKFQKNQNFYIILLLLVFSFNERRHYKIFARTKSKLQRCSI